MKELLELIETCCEATCHVCGSEMDMVRPGKWQCQKCELDNMLHEAHNKGWEQAKAEAKHLSFSCSCHKAIAAMTYKEG